MSQQFTGNLSGLLSKEIHLSGHSVGIVSHTLVYTHILLRNCDKSMCLICLELYLYAIGFILGFIEGAAVSQLSGVSRVSIERIATRPDASNFFHQPIFDSNGIGQSSRFNCGGYAGAVGV
ncbi:hypothetical protein [Halorubrum persicum]|uniref:hypothetical protein n=1 Tax=Halorubrum persicum TaxID=1383844 RepID=UPI00118189C0|nr:hypothetical protein [Halorubrum persicum]